MGGIDDVAMTEVAAFGESYPKAMIRWCFPCISLEGGGSRLE